MTRQEIENKLRELDQKPGECKKEKEKWIKRLDEVIIAEKSLSGELKTNSKKKLSKEEKWIKKQIHLEEQMKNEPHRNNKIRKT